MADASIYQSPLNTRYASVEMQQLFSDERKFKTWRALWIALAKTERELGLDITEEQIAELEKNRDNLNLDVARERERVVRHDVMSHVYAYGQQCPKAAGIIHLGATSCYVGDNTDLILMREGLKIVRRKLLNVVEKLAKFARAYREMPCLAYTHLQPAQLTTVGKRATLWINDLMLDLEEIDRRIESIRFLGSKGTTGTQASFMELFDNDEGKVKALDEKIAALMGFSGVYPVSGQTYSRKVDSFVLGTLSGVAQSAYKFSNDLRILQSFKEMEEPFEKSQIGSSAMAYKRNPMRSERMGSLCRYVLVDALNPAITASTQWFERTLDDSANKRIAVAEAFLAVDAILGIYMNVADGLVVYPKVVRSRVMAELPFMATENILMDAVKRGGDRQQLHERIRVHSQAAARAVKEEGKPNDLMERICADEAFGLTMEQVAGILSPENFTGRAPSQVSEYLDEVVEPVLRAAADQLGEHTQLDV
ncbi:adenylosuccinate lyase [Feifania hominis]|uniref:Adenylosuccinate lyase n=1 Tax=Feifania hominis TaxID=2763660 RepID=A0A926DCD0_9FIRM|nr:adenylosuccinate lyase [Feifania hominis]MBC8535224.1 adenylosuccinate lyase [Feifania hominis]